MSARDRATPRRDDDVVDPYAQKHSPTLFVLVVCAHVVVLAGALRPDWVAAIVGRLPEPVRHVLAPDDDDTEVVKEAAAAERRRQRADALDAELADDPRLVLSPDAWAAAQQRARDRYLLRNAPGLAEALSTDPSGTVEKTIAALTIGDVAAEGRDRALAQLCSANDERLAAADVTPVVEQLAAELDDVQAALVRAVVETNRRDALRRVERCEAVRRARSRFEAARESYARMAPDRIEAREIAARLADAPPTPSLLERLRVVIRRVTFPDVVRELIQGMLDSSDDATRLQGLELLADLASRDDRYVAFQRDVLANGYGRTPARPALAEAWSERAARLGIPDAIAHEIAHADTTTDAWSLSSYRLWLNANGCYTRTERGDALLLADDLLTLDALDRQLSTTQRGQARHRLAMLLRDWAPRARRLADCD